MATAGWGRPTPVERPTADLKEFTKALEDVRKRKKHPYVIFKISGRSLKEVEEEAEQSNAEEQKNEESFDKLKESLGKSNSSPRYAVFDFKSPALRKIVFITWLPEKSNKNKEVEYRRFHEYFIEGKIKGIDKYKEVKKVEELDQYYEDLQKDAEEAKEKAADEEAFFKMWPAWFNSMIKQQKR